MIGNIRNPWVRRAVLVVAFPFVLLIHLVVAAAETIVETCRDAVDVWRDL